MSEPYTLTVQQAAEKLQISRQNMYKLCKTPGFPVIQLGGILRIPVSGLEKWMEEKSTSK